MSRWKSKARRGERPLGEGTFGQRRHFLQEDRQVQSQRWAGQVRLRCSMETSV